MSTARICRFVPLFVRKPPAYSPPPPLLFVTLWTQYSHSRYETLSSLTDEPTAGQAVESVTGRGGGGGLFVFFTTSARLECSSALFTRLKFFPLGSGTNSHRQIFSRLWTSTTLKNFVQDQELPFSDFTVSMEMLGLGLLTNCFSRRLCTSPHVVR